MATPAMIAGVLLVLIGAFGYLSQEAGKQSPTALIPAIFGVLLFICGILARKDSLRKHAMHLAAVVSLLGMIGAPYPIFKRLMKGETVEPSPAVLSAAATTFICAVFLALCVRSFSAARKARQAREAAGQM